MIYLELFWSFFQVGLFSIGGGYAAMPLIQDQAVEIHPWLTMTGFADIMAIAEMTPGPIALNAATFVGIQVAGLPGALIATIGCIFPSCVIVMALAYMYYRFRGLSVMQGILAGLRPAVIAMIASAGISLLCMALYRQRTFPADLGSMDLAKVFEDLTDVMKRNGISMPSSLTMLARGLATIEGVVADLSPEINVMNVVTARMGSQLLHSIDWRGEIVRDAQAVYASAHKSLEIPSLMADILRTGLKGEANLGVEHHAGDDMARLMQNAVLKLCAALVAAALLVCGALLRDVAPLAGGLSWLTVFCFLLSAALLGWAFVWKDQKK